MKKKIPYKQNLKGRNKLIIQQKVKRWGKNQEKHVIKRKHKVTEVSPYIAAIMGNLYQVQPKD